MRASFCNLRSLKKKFASCCRDKTAKAEEQLNGYYKGTNCDVYSFIFLENKSLFTKTKWIKRIGIVRENHFQVNDVNADEGR